MSDTQLFVGRQPELECFRSILQDPAGQVVLVTGQAGMGKTLLVNMMADLARGHPDLKCGAMRYEVTPTDSLDGLMTGGPSLAKREVGARFIRKAGVSRRTLLPHARVPPSCQTQGWGPADHRSAMTTGHRQLTTKNHLLNYPSPCNPFS